MPNIPDAPDIARTLASGYPYEDDGSSMTCCKCQNDLTDTYFDTDDGYVCSECFPDYFKSYAQSNPLEAAEAIGVNVRYLI